MGAILGHHRRYRRIHTELRFHADPDGLPGVLSGEVELNDFLAGMHGGWWKRISSRGAEVGLFARVPKETFLAALETFEDSFGADPWAASSRLIHDLMDPIAAEARKPGWVEITKCNIQASPVLLRLVPEARFINMIRDGRDVASSVVTQNWGPDDFGEALTWWEERVAGGEHGSSEIPEDRLLVVGMEDLVTDDRDATFERLLEFIEEPRFLRPLRERTMRRYFNNEIGTGPANLERWRKGLSAKEQDEVNERYAKALERLISADTPARPLFERWLAALGSPVPGAV
jgi:hypothetical protein